MLRAISRLFLQTQVFLKALTYSERKKSKQDFIIRDQVTVYNMHWEFNAW